MSDELGNDPLQVEIRFKVNIRQDGELTRVIIIQGAFHISLTAEQANALGEQLRARFP